MHRLLISFEYGIIVYSINKNRVLYTLILTKEKHFHLGKALAVDWSANDDILVGFSKGLIHLYKTDGVATGNKHKAILAFSS